MSGSAAQADASAWTATAAASNERIRRGETAILRPFDLSFSVEFPTVEERIEENQVRKISGR